MTSTKKPPAEARVNGWLVPGVAAVVLGGALLVLVGWWRDIPVLKSVVPGQVSMKANTAVGFVLLALALGFSRGPAGRRVVLACVLAVVGLGAATLVEYLGNVNLGIDERLFRDDVGAVATSNPGRMAPFTAFNFVLAGSAVWLVFRPRWVGVAQGLALGVMVGALFNVVGYLFQSASFYRFGAYTALALHTAVGFWLVGWGVLGVRAEAGLMRVVTRPTPTGRMLRRWLCGALVVPVVIAWLRLQGERAGLYDTAFGLAMITLTGVVLLVVVSWVTARRLEQVDDERQRAADALREANERLEQRVAVRTAELDRVSRLQRAVLDGTVFSVIATHVDGTIMEYNEGAQRLLGYPAAEMVERQSLTLVHLDVELAARAGELSVQLGREIAPGYETLVALARIGRADEREWTYLGKDGSRIPVRLRMSALCDQAGEVTGFLAVAQDLSETKVAERALAATEERLHRVLSHADCLVWEAQVTLTDQDWHWQMTVHPSGLYRRLSDGVAVPPCGDLWHQFDLPERAEINRRRRAALESDAPGYEQEFQLVRNGRVVWLRETVSITPVRPGCFWVVGVAVDITERKAIEASRRASEERFRLFADLAPVGICQTDTKGRCTYVNKRWCAITGRTAKEAVGENWAEAVHQEDRRRVLAVWVSLVRGAPETALEYRFVHPDGTVVWVAGSAIRLTDERGQITGYLGSVTDITAGNELSVSLALARDQALEASRLKSEFLATMSHEIRTPMNAVMGMAGLLEDTPLNPEQREMVHTMLGGADALLTIINDILDFSRIEAGKLRLDPVDFDCRDLVETTVALLAPRAEEKGIRLTWELAAMPSGRLHGDSGRLRQVLTNLLGNAIKFTDVGGVTLVVRTPVVTDQRCRVRVEVRDTGVGISAEAQRRLFQPFMQADGSTTRRFGGTGLGLAICRQLVALMGGEIGLESEAGQGSLFWFELEFERRRTAVSSAVGTTEARVAEAQGIGRRLLLVEDNPANQKVATMLLRKLGYTVEVASDGQQALEKLAAEAFDVVLMDCQMPTMDGYEATRRIRAGQVPGLEVTLPIIALTAYARPEDRQRCVEAGMDDYVTKPIRVAELSAALERCAAKREATAPLAGAGEARTEGETERVLDEEALETARGLPGNEGPSLLPELIGLYLSDEAERLAEMERLAQARHGEQLWEEAHSFGGNAASFGGAQVRRVALELEHVARAGDWPAVAGKLTQLRRACERLRTEVAKRGLAE